MKNLPGCGEYVREHLQHIVRVSRIRSAFVLAVLILPGCVTTPREAPMVEPLPQEQAIAEEPASETPKVVEDLLRAAEAELRQANEALEGGDREKAANHYYRMLELLLEADLDPDLFYGVREKFDDIIRTYRKTAHLYHHPDRRIGEAHSGAYSNLTIPYPMPPRLQAEINELINSYPGTFQRGLNRSARFLPYLKEEFKKAGLPEELAWLAMVESMFQPKVVSPAGAAGMWQFMRATGRRYTLRMDSYVDERNNWHSATRAAIEYLKNLHDFFDGDWALAVTGYNMGEYGLERAIVANDGNRDFWSLVETPPAAERIKEESKKFFPRLLAYIIVANAPEQYGFTYEPEPFEDVLRIPVQGAYSLAALEAAMDLPKGTLAALNPDLLRETTPPQGEYPVAAPRHLRETFLAALQQVPTVRGVSEPVVTLASSGGAHRVRRGETLSEIARKYGTCPNDLMRINRIKSAKSLQVNQVLTIPDSARRKPAAAPEPAAQPSTNARAATAERVQEPKQTTPRNAQTAATLYTVKGGDTLYDIAVKHRVTVAQLQQWNELGGRSNLKIGQQLKIQAPAAQTPSGPVQTHVVKPGEYPAIIADLYGIGLNDFMRWNELTERSVIRPGDKLIVAGTPGTPKRQAAAAAPAAIPAAPTAVTHKVAAGETISGIATKHGVAMSDLLAWNQLTTKSILRVGQELVLKASAKNAAQRSTGTEGQAMHRAAEAVRRIIHKVVAGENPSSISRKYKVQVADLFKWNNWTDNHVLHIGDEVAILED